MATASTTVTPFGGRLRSWRRAAGVSQLELAHRAATTPRHLSFLESGRSRPSAGMVERLAEALALPLRERNALLAAAGLPPAFAETPLDAEDLAPFRAVVTQLLAGHEPYPAFVVDRHWNVVQANRPAAMLLPPAGGANLVRLSYEGPWRGLIANWDELAWPGVRRLEREAAARPGDDVLAGLVSIARAAVAGLPETHPAGGERVLCPHFRVGDQVIRTASVVAHFGQPLDVTLEELRIELICPADAEAERFFRAAAAAE